MKICQTLSSNYKDILTDSFGWYSPQHHLMAWAYSCLKLKEFYPNVHLYTDSDSAKILIDKIQIPYVEYHIEYDQWKYNHSLWAYSKILTYNKQEESFIHVDGDVFIEEQFKETFTKARLIAQNEEISTDFNKKLFEPILPKIIYTPDFFKENLYTEYPKSYNAGIMGGNDIELLQKYSWEAIQFVEKNYPCQPNGNFSMIFEQVLFYAFARDNNVEPACVFDKVYDDNGYIHDDFGDLSTLKYTHLIGPLKRDKFICDQLVRRLYTEYPAYFERVVSLFPSTHKYTTYFMHEDTNEAVQEFEYVKTRSVMNELYPDGNSDKCQSVESFVSSKNNTILNEIFKYEKALDELISTKFKCIELKVIEQMEYDVLTSNEFLTSLQGKISMNPYIEIIETPFDVINFNPFEILSERKVDKIVACVPSLFFDGFKEVNLDDLSVNILAILEEEPEAITYDQLKEKASEQFERVENDEDVIDSLLQKKLKFLIGNNLVHVQ